MPERLRHSRTSLQASRPNFRIGDGSDTIVGTSLSIAGNRSALQPAFGSVVSQASTSGFRCEIQRVQADRVNGAHHSLESI
jgi:hypothetical protein